MFDLVIRNGLVVDGSGAEPVQVDVAIRDGLIAEVGRVEGCGRQERDATGRIVTPGFVDIHTHYDGQAIWSDRMTPSSAHGVTTAVMGNCGVGFAPCRPGDHDLLVKVMEGVEDIPGVVMAEGLPWTWESFPQYLDAVEGRAHDIDVAALLPHSPLRVYVMGQRGADRETATSQDLSEMRRLTCEAIQAGALGFASSRISVHRTADGAAIPSYAAADAELEAIAAGMTDAGSGLIQVVPDLPKGGWESELRPLIELARRTGQPVTFTLGAPNSGPPIWREALAMLAEANAKGAVVKAQVFPRPIGMVVGFDLSTHSFATTPSYQALAHLPLAERIAELRRPQVRARILAEPPGEGHPLAAMGRSFDWMFPLRDPPDYEPPPETSVGAQARRLGVSPETVAYDLLLQDEGHAMLLVALGNYPDGSLDDLAELLRDDNVVVGLGDGGAHYGMICDASYPTFVLAHWVRDRAGVRLSLAEAVKTLAADPARLVGLNDRGQLRPGFKADLNIIDLDRLVLHAPRVVSDLPAGGRRLDQTAHGYEATFVSGELIAELGVPTGRTPGRLVRGPRKPPTRLGEGGYGLISGGYGLS